MRQQVSHFESRHSPSNRTGERRPDIQGLRAIAVLMVVAFHSGLPVPGGFVGVDVFFVISGFVISAMLRREWETTGRVRLGLFYARRFKRLAPALALMVATTVVVSALVLSPAGTQQTAAKTAIGAIFLSANLAIAATTGGYFDAPAHDNPLLHTWSLSVEEQFYLALPILLILGWRVSSGVLRFAPILIVGILAAASLGLTLLGPNGSSSLFTGYSWLVGFYSPIIRAWEFAAGCLLALTGFRLGPSSYRIASILGGTGLLALGASLWLISAKTPFPGAWTILPVIGTTLLIVAGDCSSNVVSRGLGALPMVKIGDWSYSIYLWHWPLIVFVGAIWPGRPSLLVPAIAFSLGLALASYFWIEQPLRLATWTSRGTFVGFAMVTIMIPSFLSGALGLAARNWFWDDSLQRKMDAVRSLPTGWNDPLCVSRTPVDRRDVRPCQWHSSAKGAPVYLIGDSNAMHFSEALMEAGLALQRPVTALGSDGCPLIDVYIQRDTDPSLVGECREDYLALMRWLARQPAGTVMVASVDRYWRDPDYLVSPDANFTTDQFLHNSRALNAGFAKTVTELQRAGHYVILIQTIPHFIAEPYTIERAICSGWSVLVRSCHPPFATMPVEFADEWQSESREGIRKVATETGARVFDLRDFFCQKSICSTRHESGIDLYMLDGYHLNRHGSALLKGEFVIELSFAASR